MAFKLSDQMAYPPRGMRAPRAAAYLGMSESTFLGLVGEGKMPLPVKVRGMAIWDRQDLDDASFSRMAQQALALNRTGREVQ